MPNVVEPVERAPSRRRSRLILAGIAIGLSIIAAVTLWPRDIDAPTAARMADQLLVQYTRVNAEPRRNFAAREDRIWADGWEFRWRYQPCPQFASLRVWISRDGKRASYAELPDCAPTQGYLVNPLKV